MVKMAAAVGLGIPFLIALWSGLAGITPTGPKAITYNFTSMYIALGLNLTFWGAGLIYRISGKKAWWALYIFSVTLAPAVFGVAVLNLVYASLPDWRWVLPLAAMYVIAAILPFVNEKLAEILHTEIFAPRSCLGQIIAFSALACAPVAGFFGAFLSGLSERAGNGVIGFSIFGLIFHFLSVWTTISLVYQAWNQRPWKKAVEE
jgi:hypothetical protein